MLLNNYANIILYFAAVDSCHYIKISHSILREDSSHICNTRYNATTSPLATLQNVISVFRRF